MMVSPQPDVPEALRPYRTHLEGRLREVHGIELDDRLYGMMMRWMASFERGKASTQLDPTLYIKSHDEISRGQQAEERGEDRAQYLKTIDEQRALWAFKLRFGGVEKFVPIICHRLLKAPIDTLPMNAFARYGRHLHYATKLSRDLFDKTLVSILRNYDLGRMPFNFALYVAMCELVRSGKSEPIKYRVQDATAHRIRLKLYEAAMMPRTFYVLWHDEHHLIIGTLRRSIAESLVAT